MRLPGVGTCFRVAAYLLLGAGVLGGAKCQYDIFKDGIDKKEKLVREEVDQREREIRKELENKEAAYRKELADKEVSYRKELKDKEKELRLLLDATLAIYERNREQDKNEVRKLREEIERLRQELNLRSAQPQVQAPVTKRKD